jgi:hypothetical protein
MQRQPVAWIKIGYSFCHVEHIWAQNGPNMGPKWFQYGPIWAQLGPDETPCASMICCVCVCVCVFSFCRLFLFRCCLRSVLSSPSPCRLPLLPSLCSSRVLPLSWASWPCLSFVHAHTQTHTHIPLLLQAREPASIHRTLELVQARGPAAIHAAIDNSV